MVFVVIINNSVQFTGATEIDCRNYILSIKDNFKFGDQIYLAQVLKSATVSIQIQIV